MTTIAKENVTLKKDLLRYNEYYRTQEILDKLYKESQQGNVFTKLIELIASDANLLLAYRTIKSNKGSTTKGVNDTTIVDWESKDTKEYLRYMKERLRNYIPFAVRRVEIPKANGKKRPLGIPTIEDRLIQQSIKQILEPICEAKFYEHSYGFRPNRSTEHAIAYFMFRVNLCHCQYVVDIDIKGFFDNVNHGKLIRQLWSMGIRDKRLLCIVSKMLKAPIEENGSLTIPTCGTPQGGILSPLLSNIVLNELDHWISSQWTDFVSIKAPLRVKMNKGKVDKSPMYNTLRKTKLKEIYIVRYADDFKILCKDHKTAWKTYHAVKAWLKERLKLDISPEKSGVTNLRRRGTEFLGFQLKAKAKGKKYVIQSNMCEKAKKRTLENMRNALVTIQRHPNLKNVGNYNSKVMGVQNYFQHATYVNIDMAEIAYLLSRKIHNRLKQVESKEGLTGSIYEKRYKNNYKKHFVAGIALFPLGDVQTKPPKLFNQQICNYTEKGRDIIHGKLAYINPEIFKYLVINPPINGSVQLYDNRLSLFAAQQGKCGISGELLTIHNMEVHHITPTGQGGTDQYKNLIYVTKDIHNLIHRKEIPNLNSKEYELLVKLSLENKLQRLNKYRRKVGNEDFLVSSYRGLLTVNTMRSF